MLRGKHGHNHQYILNPATPLRVRGRTVARTEGIPHHDSRKVHAGHTIHDDENPGIRQVAEAVIETNYKSKNKKK